MQMSSWCLFPVWAKPDKGKYITEQEEIKEFVRKKPLINIGKGPLLELFESKKYRRIMAVLDNVLNTV